MSGRGYTENHIRHTYFTNVLLRVMMLILVLRRYSY